MFPALPALLAVDYLDQVGSVNQNKETPESANQQKTGNWEMVRVVDLKDQVRQPRPKASLAIHVVIVAL